MNQPIQQENTELKYLTLAVVLICAFLLARELFLKTKPLQMPSIFSTTTEQAPPPIDFEVLKEKEIENLSPFEKIFFPKRIGRENPFAPF